MALVWGAALGLVGLIPIYVAGNFVGEYMAARVGASVCQRSADRRLLAAAGAVGGLSPRQDARRPAVAVQLRSRRRRARDRDGVPVRVGLPADHRHRRGPAARGRMAAGARALRADADGHHRPALAGHASQPRELRAPARRRGRHERGRGEPGRPRRDQGVRSPGHDARRLRPSARDAVPKHGACELAERAPGGLHQRQRIDPAHHRDHGRRGARRAGRAVGRRTGGGDRPALVHGRVAAGAGQCRPAAAAGRRRHGTHSGSARRTRGSAR